MAGSGDSGLYSSATGGAISRPAVAEFVGTFVLVFVGCSVAVAAALERPVAGPPYNSLAIALAFGLALVAVVAAIGHISGGHVNPAVTVGQASAGLFPWRNVPAYIVAQLLGAVAAALAVWLCFGDAAHDQANLGATALPQDVSVGRGLATEALITFVLVFVGGPLTGGGVNPARALGPMLVSGQLDDFWLYIVGPLIGGALAAFVAVYLLRAFQMEQDDDPDDGDERGGRLRRVDASSRTRDGDLERARGR